MGSIGKNTKKLEEVPTSKLSDASLRLDLQFFASKGTNNPNSWKRGTEVTEAHVREAMKNAPLQTQQNAVSLPAVNRYTQRLANGEVPPPIKVDSGIIVDGNHRYISSRIVGKKIDEVPGSGGRIDRVVKWKDIFIDPFDWGNK